MSSSLFGHRLECCLTQLQIATMFPISVHPAPCYWHSDASAPPPWQHRLCDSQLIEQRYMYVRQRWPSGRLNPDVFYGQQQIPQEVDLTGQQMVPWQDHWKLDGLVLRQILYRVVAEFLRCRWHSLVEEPQRCAGICMTSPLDRELRHLSDFQARR